MANLEKTKATGSFGKRILGFCFKIIIITTITACLYFGVDWIYGRLFPVYPWEQNANIIASVSYINDKNFSHDFMLEQEELSNRKHWSAPKDTRLVFRNEFHGKYINIEPLESGSKKPYRRTINQYSQSQEGVKKVLMLGGSTLFCLEVPDELTVSSQLSKMLNKDGKYNIVNAGIESDTTFQELERLKLELKSGYIPDIVIAYHGFNEINGGVYYNDPEGDIWENIVRNRVKDYLHYLIKDGGIIKGNIYRDILSKKTRDDTTPKSVPGHLMEESNIDSLVKMARESFIKNNEEMFRLSKEYNFEYYSIIQPIAVYGDYGSENTDINMIREWTRINQPLFLEVFEKGYPEILKAAKELSSKGIKSFDLSEALTGKKENVFTDTCHINGVGNSKVADAIYEIIRNDLSKNATE